MKLMNLEKAGVPERPSQSRAVMRGIEAGCYVECAGCETLITFSMQRQGAQQVIANVYDGDQWQRVEHYHVGCYEAAMQPYGPTPEQSTAGRRRRGPQAMGGAAIQA